MHKAIQLPATGARHAHHALAVLLLCAAGALALAVPSLRNGVFDAMSTDDAMRLAGVRDLLAGQSWFDLTQHRLDPPQGSPMHWSRLIDAPIARHPKHDHKFAVMAGGRHSITHYTTLEAHRFASLLEVHLETGRTHQIRVHMAALKHPCVGDFHYGADPVLAKRVGLERQWLHAVRLGFVHPESGEYVEFESPYPDDLAHALDVIRDAH